MCVMLICLISSLYQLLVTKMSSIVSAEVFIRHPTQPARYWGGNVSMKSEKKRNRGSLTSWSSSWSFRKCRFCFNQQKHRFGSFSLQQSDDRLWRSPWAWFTLIPSQWDSSLDRMVSYHIICLTCKAPASSIFISSCEGGGGWMWFRALCMHRLG